MDDFSFLFFIAIFVFNAERRSFIYLFILTQPALEPPFPPSIQPMRLNFTAWLVHRASAGGSVLSAACGKLSVGRSLGKLTPRQLGDEDEIDEDVKAEADRVAHGGADSDVVKVGSCASSIMCSCNISRYLLVRLSERRGSADP